LETQLLHFEVLTGRLHFAWRDDQTDADLFQPMGLKKK